MAYAYGLEPYSERIVGSSPTLPTTFMETNKRLHKLLVILLLSISLFLHLVCLSYPAEPVFDERYFATYAVAYRTHTPYFDLHPPLGKMLYALPLFLFSTSSLADAPFIDLKIDSAGTVHPKMFSNPYNFFPYVPLRLVSAFFGVLLVFAMYLFIKAVTQNDSAALLGMFFATFENALLVDTRLILLNGMYLSLGFLALAFVLKGKSRPIIGGILWGLALSVKLTAVVFLGPLLIAYFLKRRLERLWLRRLLTFVGTGFVVLFLVWFVANNLLIPAEERIALYQPLFAWMGSGPPIFQNPSSLPAVLLRNVKASVMDVAIALFGYTSGGINPNDFISSKWYTWPAMFKPLVFFRETVGTAIKQIAFVGNPAVWVFGTLSILYGIFLLVRKLRERKYDHTLLLLGGGYLASLIPFILVARSTYIYHYLPAFLFSLSLAAVFIEKHIRAEKAHNRFLPLALTIGTVLLGFLVTLPLTYGL